LLLGICYTYSGPLIIDMLLVAQINNIRKQSKKKYIIKTGVDQPLYRQ
jgi:hypothetical protein